MKRAKTTTRNKLVVTRAELARLTRSTPDQVSKKIQEGMPGVVRTGGGRGRPTEIDLGRALPWLVDRRTNGLDEERERYFRLQGDKLDLEIRTRTGELVETSTVEERWAAIAVSVRERLLSLPSIALQRGFIDDSGEDGLIGLVGDILSELQAPGEKPTKASKQKS